MNIPCFCEVESSPYPQFQIQNIYSHGIKTPAAAQVSAELAEPAYNILPHPVFLQRHAQIHTLTAVPMTGLKGKAAVVQSLKETVVLWLHWISRKIRYVRKICPHMWTEKTFVLGCVCMCVCVHSSV